MASTLRLSAPLSARATAYAEKIGVSVAALVAIALADYLDSRERVVEASAPPTGDARGEGVPTSPPAAGKPATAVLTGAERRALMSSPTASMNREQRRAAKKAKR